MYKRLPYLFLSLAVLCIVSAPALGQVKGAVVQQWNYDPIHNPPLVTVKIVNNSHKDITAYNIAIKETYADGRVEQHEFLRDLVGKIILAKELGAANTPEAQFFHKMYGSDGAFHPGEVRDEELGVQPGLTHYEAVIDVVTNVDGTTESANDDALGRIVDERQANLASQKIAVEIIKAALADTNDANPALTAAKKIRDRSTTWKAQQHTKLDLDSVRLDSIADELTLRRGAAKEILAREEARIAILSVHSRPAKVGGPQ